MLSFKYFSYDFGTTSRSLQLSQPLPLSPLEKPLLRLMQMLHRLENTFLAPKMVVVKHVFSWKLVLFTYHTR